MRSGLPDVAEVFRQGLDIAAPQLDIVGRGGAGFETDGLADDKCRRFGLGLADAFRGAGSAVAAVKKFVRLCCVQHKHIYVVLALMLCSKVRPQ